ncbi:MAG TPA: 30S ribosome-binding factor RbfA [Pyrinomonadaceae bacterium]|jgi:ribosome-binding factor A|nr:30S ribosome-binding factor RbfA [Pyrinomonadaceae bacterium]
MRRPEKLAELVREEIMQIVGFELDDPRVASVTVTEVRMTENLRDARVFVTVLGTEEEKKAALVALKKAAPYVRRQLGSVLNMRYTPEIHFMRDTIEESASRVSDLLAEIGQDGSLQPPADETPDKRKDEDEG